MEAVISKKLLAMTKEASLHASQALSQLSDEKITVGVAKTQITRIAKGFPDIDPETIVAGIYLPVTGDVSGASLLVLPAEIAYGICDLLMKRASGTTHKLTELDISALEEVGNIICGNFLTALCNTLKMKIVENVPQFSFDMFGAVVDVIISGLARKADEALFVEVTFVFEHEDIKGYLVLIFGLQDMQAILRALEAVE
jgi:chemotaxis protein CheC